MARGFPENINIDKNHLSFHIHPSSPSSPLLSLNPFIPSLFNSMADCLSFSLANPVGVSYDNEVFFSKDCSSNVLKAQVFEAWLAIFSLQLAITVAITIREWVLYGASHGAAILIMVCFNILGKSTFPFAFSK